MEGSRSHAIAEPARVQYQRDRFTGSQQPFRVGATAIFICAAPSALIFDAIPRFESLFRGFGPDLRDTTMFVLQWRYVLALLPTLALLLLFFSFTLSGEKAIA
jgi:hypothetical protein